MKLVCMRIAGYWCAIPEGKPLTVHFRSANRANVQDFIKDNTPWIGEYNKARNGQVSARVWRNKS